ncbi:MAG TPA: helix-turn-helix domain-containing protein [Galbitalea sp.]|jgi:DNA-binding HxlR family transcriptional regulator
MSSVLGTDQFCSVARSLEVLGDKWSLLIVRQAFFGETRFSQFRDSLGMAKNVLADRLATLVSFGVLAPRAYREDGEREREEYILTAPGRELVYVLGALSGWGDRHRPSDHSPTRIYQDGETGERVELQFVTAAGRVVHGTDVVATEPLERAAAGSSAPR